MTKPTTKKVTSANEIQRSKLQAYFGLLKARITSKEWVLSSFQYATGWLLMILFIYGFVLQFFIEEVPYIPVLSDYFVTLLMVTFFTHAMLGIRSTTIRYHVYRPWLDLAFLPLWIFICVTFVLT